MNKKQFLEYTNKILKGSNHLKTDKTVGMLFMDYARDRRNELVDKVNRSSATDNSDLAAFIDELTALIASDETIIMVLNTYAKDTTIDPIHLKHLVKKVTDKYINGAISRYNSTYDDLK